MGTCGADLDRRSGGDRVAVHPGQRALGLRGSLEEGEPQVVPGTYVNGFFEERPLPHAEAGYGFPESGQTVVNVTDGKLIRLHVGDSPLDIRYGSPSHERMLDLRAGRARRRPIGRRRTARASRSRPTPGVLHPALLAAIRYEVEPLDDGFYIAVQSDLLANEHRQGLDATRATPRP